MFNPLFEDVDPEYRELLLTEREKARADKIRTNYQDYIDQGYIKSQQDVPAFIERMQKLERINHEAVKKNDDFKTSRAIKLNSYTSLSQSDRGLIEVIVAERKEEAGEKFSQAQADQIRLDYANNPSEMQGLRENKTIIAKAAEAEKQELAELNEKERAAALGKSLDQMEHSKKEAYAHLSADDKKLVDEQVSREQAKHKAPLPEKNVENLKMRYAQPGQLNALRMQKYDQLKPEDKALVERVVNAPEMGLTSNQDKANARQHFSSPEGLKELHALKDAPLPSLSLAASAPKPAPVKKAKVTAEIQQVQPSEYDDLTEEQQGKIEKNLEKEIALRGVKNPMSEEEKGAFRELHVFDVMPAVKPPRPPEEPKAEVCVAVASKPVPSASGSLRLGTGSMLRRTFEKIFPGLGNKELSKLANDATGTVVADMVENEQAFKKGDMSFVPKIVDHLLKENPQALEDLLAAQKTMQIYAPKEDDIRNSISRPLANALFNKRNELIKDMDYSLSQALKEGPGATPKAPAAGANNKDGNERF